MSGDGHWSLVICHWLEDIFIEPMAIYENSNIIRLYLRDQY